MKKYILIIVALILLVSLNERVTAQSSVPSTYTSTSALSGTVTLQARSSFVLGPGFSYTPNGGTLTMQFVDPFVTGDVSYSLSQKEPLTTSISTIAYQPGSLPGSVNVSQLGSAGYNIPIQAPAGVGGFQPSLSVNYSSLGGDGILGKGWNFAGLGEVTRIPATMYYDGVVDPVDFDSSDRFALNGSRLIYYSGTYGQSGSTYRLENDQSVKISLNSNVFTVKTADGLTYEYGGTTDSKTVESWKLNKIMNNFGQIINISYAKIGDWAYPVLIDYGVSTIEFYYKNRNADHVYYINGNSIILQNVLDRIQVWNDETLIRKYQFNYFKTNENDSPLLNEIIYYGMNNERLNSTIFKYQLIDYDLTDQITAKTNSYINYKYRLVNGDFDCDGKADILCIPNPDEGQTDGIWRVQLSDGEQNFSIPESPYLEINPGIDFDDLREVAAIDLTGDGRDDIVFTEVVSSGLFSVTTNFYYIRNNKTNRFR